MSIAVIILSSFTIGDLLNQEFNFESRTENLMLTEFFISKFPQSERYFNDVAAKCGLDTLTADRGEVFNLYSAYGSPKLFHDAVSLLGDGDIEGYEEVLSKIDCK